jgi:hypothetical protein
MKYLLSLLALLFLVSCVKRPSKDPVPSIEFIAFNTENTTTAKGSFLIDYEDGDGNLFSPEDNPTPNFICSFYYYNKATGNYDPYITNLIFPDGSTLKDTFRITTSVRNPKDLDLKNKPIKGSIYIPLTQYRSSDTIKIFKYSMFMVDRAGNKSNIITSPSYTVN